MAFQSSGFGVLENHVLDTRLDLVFVRHFLAVRSAAQVEDDLELLSIVLTREQGFLSE